MIRCSAATESGPTGSRRSAGVVDRQDEPGPRRVGAQRDDDPKRRAREPTESELERRGGRWIEPLRVVHGEQDRAAVRQLAQDREQGSADEAAARRAAGVRAQQRDVDRVALRRRQQREDLVSDRLEQVGEGGEGEPRLRLRGPRGDDAQPARVAAPAPPPARWSSCRYRALRRSPARRATARPRREAPRRQPTRARAQRGRSRTERTPRSVAVETVGRRCRPGGYATPVATSWAVDKGIVLPAQNRYRAPCAESVQR